MEFSTNHDKENTIREGPWTFDKHLVVFKEVEEILQVQEIHFTNAQFFIRIHHLPIFTRNATISQLICSKFGDVIEVDLEENGASWGGYTRVPMCLNKPNHFSEVKNLV